MFLLENKLPEKPAKPPWMSLTHQKLFLRKLNKWLQEDDLVFLGSWSLLQGEVSGLPPRLIGRKNRDYMALFKVICSRDIKAFLIFIFPTPLPPNFFPHHVWEFSQSTPKRLAPDDEFSLHAVGLDELRLGEDTTQKEREGVARRPVAAPATFQVEATGAWATRRQ